MGTMDFIERVIFEKFSEDSDGFAFTEPSPPSTVMRYITPPHRPEIHHERESLIPFRKESETVQIQ